MHARRHTYTMQNSSTAVEERMKVRFHKTNSWANDRTGKVGHRQDLLQHVPKGIQKDNVSMPTLRLS